MAEHVVQFSDQGWGDALKLAVPLFLGVFVIGFLARLLRWATGGLG